MLNQSLISLAIIVIYLLVYSLARRFLGRFGESRHIPLRRIYYIQLFFNLMMLVVMVIAISLVWSIDYHGLLLFASSFFAVMGVALFAEWSILSNITSTVIIFFAMNVGIGDRIRIIDGDNSITGIIDDISLFHLTLIDDDKNEITYPNNLLLRKPVVKLNKAKLG